MRSTIIRVYIKDIPRLRRIKKEKESSAKLIRRLIDYFEINTEGVCYGEI